MDNNCKPCGIGELRKIIWPIEWHENKKFLPMALMLFCALFNYSLLRSVKDGFVVTAIGAESIGFLKTYVVLPAAIIAMVIYTKLCNIMSMQKVFYTILAFFVLYFIAFALVLYPHQHLVHPDPESIAAWSVDYPNFKWFIRIIGKWSYAIFYTMAELWGSLIVSLLFWQFANQITKTAEAKRFYAMFGVLGNLGLIVTGEAGERLLGSKEGLITLILWASVAGVVIMLTYAWMQMYVLTDPRLYTPSSSSTKKGKAKLSMKESFKLILSSKYLGLLALLVLSYGISINLVEGIWKSKIRELNPSEIAYTMYMTRFQKYQGIVAILFMLVGSNILRKLSWYKAAICTPLMILVTGIGFFSFIFFDQTVGLYFAVLFASQPLAAAVTLGAIQNILSKATKYSLFDATKEMAYIPLDDEIKSKGKAAVDVVGGRAGKTGGGFIQSTFFFAFPALGFTEAMPYFAMIFFVIVMLWVYAVHALSNEYNNQLELRSAEETAS